MYEWGEKMSLLTKMLLEKLTGHISTVSNLYGPGKHTERIWKISNVYLQLMWWIEPKRVEWDWKYVTGSIHSMNWRHHSDSFPYNFEIAHFSRSVGLKLKQHNIFSPHWDRDRTKCAGFKKAFLTISDFLKKNSSTKSRAHFSARNRLIDLKKKLILKQVFKIDFSWHFLIFFTVFNK